MIKIGVLGSHYFKYYVEDIQGSHLFENVELAYYPTKDEIYTTIASKIKMENCHALVMAPGDYAYISALVKKSMIMKKRQSFFGSRRIWTFLFWKNL